MAVGAGIINIDTQAIHMVKSQAQPRAAVPHEHSDLHLCFAVSSMYVHDWS